MHVRSLHTLPQMDQVLEMQQKLSAATSEAELMHVFTARFSQLAGATLFLDLEVADLQDGEFRVRNRVCMDPVPSLRDILEDDRWNHSAEDLAVHRSEVLSPLVNGDQPKWVRDLVPAHAPEILGDSKEACNALACPIFQEGQLHHWLIVLTAYDLGDEITVLRQSVSLLNLFARTVAQTRMRRRIDALHKRLELGLTEVARIQQHILPDVPTVDGLDLAVMYRPSAIASGDYYDFRHFADGRLGIVVADVAGHGPGAAVVMAMLRTIMNTYRLAKMEPESVVSYANRLIRDGLSSGAFVTAVFVALDPRTGNGIYFCCGHCSPLRVTADGDVVELKEGGSPPLGILDDLDPTPGHFVLGEGESLFLYTDGIVEAPSRTDRSRFGTVRLHDLLRQLDAPETSVARLGDELARFSGDTPRRDDECAVLIQRTPGPPITTK